jgi:hypothetical protein
VALPIIKKRHIIGQLLITLKKIIGLVKIIFLKAQHKENNIKVSPSRFLRMVIIPELNLLLF